MQLLVLSLLLLLVFSPYVRAEDPEVNLSAVSGIGYLNVRVLIVAFAKSADAAVLC
jgi:hypothetical protein